MTDLAYTRDQLSTILEDFFNALGVEDFKKELLSLAPDETNISRRIEQRQRQILATHNIDPDRGMRDLSRVRRVYANDKEILEKLIIVAGKEEAITNEALGIVASPTANMQVPRSMHQVQHMMQNLPQLLAQFQQQVHQNPQILEQMSPQQRAQYQHLVGLVQQAQTRGQQSDVGVPTSQQAPPPQQQQPPPLQQVATTEGAAGGPSSTTTTTTTTDGGAPNTAQGIFGSLMSMFGYGSAPPVGRTMSKDD